MSYGASTWEMDSRLAWHWQANKGHHYRQGHYITTTNDKVTPKFSECVCVCVHAHTSKEVAYGWQSCGREMLPEVNKICFVHVLSFEIMLSWPLRSWTCNLQEMIRSGGSLVHNIQKWNDFLEQCIVDQTMLPRTHDCNCSDCQHSRCKRKGVIHFYRQ
jgi:hypothetical protein